MLVSLWFLLTERLLSTTAAQTPRPAPAPRQLRRPRPFGPPGRWLVWLPCVLGFAAALGAHPSAAPGAAHPHRRAWSGLPRAQGHLLRVDAGALRAGGRRPPEGAARAREGPHVDCGQGGIRPAGHPQAELGDAPGGVGGSGCGGERRGRGPGACGGGRRWEGFILRRAGGAKAGGGGRGSWPRCGCGFACGGRRQAVTGRGRTDDERGRVAVMGGGSAAGSAGFGSGSGAELCVRRGAAGHRRRVA